MSDELFQAISKKVSYEEVREILEKHPKAAKLTDIRNENTLCAYLLCIQ
jgi:hypothetical protein